MSAETLRQAAALMRERAEAIPAPDGDDITASWADEYGPTGSMNGLERVEAEHIASWHPAVALAVADWLDEVYCALTGSWVDGVTTVGPVGVSEERNALSVARAFLGGKP